jgi:putative ABC transport system permease protein
MSAIWQDLKFAVRDLRKGILITSLAVVSLAVAIAGNTTVFGLVNAILFRPLPYPEPERLVILGEREENSPPTLVAASANLVDWKERNRSFVDLAGMRPAPMSLGAGERPEPVTAAQASPGLFEILGTRAFRGRTLGREPNRQVALLTYRFASERFDPGVDPVGKTIVLNREPYTVVGVLPSSFEFLDPRIQLFVPLSLERQDVSRERRDTLVVGRLAPGVTMEQAKADMKDIQERLAREYPESNRGFVIDALNFRYEIPDSRGRTMFALLQGAVVFVLLIACVNIANLLLARTQARRREIALRTALGAGRGRIVRQLLTESVLLAILGGVLGLGLGVVSLRVMAARFANLFPSYWIPVVDGSVLAVTLGLTGLSGLLFGLSPALMSFKVNLAEVVKEGGRGSAGANRRLLSRALVVAEIALSIVLLGGGSVLVQSFLALRNSDPGFEMEHLLAVTVSLPTGDDVDRVELTRRLIERATTLPGVVQAAAASALPQNVFVSTSSFVIDEQPLAPDEPHPRAVLIKASPTYPDALGFPVLQGRFFDERDRADASPVAVISRSLAERHWPGVGDVLGRHITVESASREIVGVVEEVRQSLMRQGEGSQGTIYLPVAQSPIPTAFVLVRTRVDPHGLAGSIRNQIDETDPRIAIARIETMREFVDQFFVGVNVFNSILSVFGVLALLLAALGTYGVLAYNVAQRSQEIGVRMAMGAAPRKISSMFSRQGIWLGVLGLLIGTPGVLGVTRIIASVLVYAPPIQPLTIVTVFVVLFLTTLAASYFPARRAASLDPVIVLRRE